MLIGIIDVAGNDLDFCLVVDEKDAELAKKCGEMGMLAWYCATHPEDWEDNEYFTKEDVESFYDLGYCEPTEILLKRYGIPYTIVNPEYNEKDEMIADDYVEV